MKHELFWMISFSSCSYQFLVLSLMEIFLIDFMSTKHEARYSSLAFIDFRRLQEIGSYREKENMYIQVKSINAYKYHWISRMNYVFLFLQ